MTQTEAPVSIAPGFGPQTETAMARDQLIRDYWAARYAVERVVASAKTLAALRREQPAGAEDSGLWSGCPVEGRAGQAVLGAVAIATGNRATITRPPAPHTHPTTPVLSKGR